MAGPDPRRIGRVRHVIGSQVTIELDPTMAGVAPVWAGRLQAVGEVGSLILIPQGPVTLVAAVTLVGIAELTGPLPPAHESTVGDRWLQAQLLGEVNTFGKFQRGVSMYPALDDAALFATPSDLRPLFPPPGEEWVQVGRLSASSEIPYTLNAARLVVRHGAILGSTGAGKSSAVSRLIQSLATQGWPAANIVLIDPHGEYSAALGAHASVRSVLGSGAAALRVPNWALPAADLLTALAGPVEGATTRSAWAEYVTQCRRAFAEEAAWLNVDPESISADTPIPFDVNQAWHHLDYENRATYSAMRGDGDPQIVSPGDPATLTSTKFAAYGIASRAPYQGPRYGAHGTIPDRIRLRLLDPRFKFLREPRAADSLTSDPLVDVLDEWLGGTKPVSVLDFSGVPGEVSDLAIGLVIQLLFEVAVRSEVSGIGRPRPVLIVLEEAHRYLGDRATVRTSREAVDRVAREGRKYGVGILLVTQRPSELPPTSLAQVGTIIALRLTNAGDQATIKAALPDSVAGLADTLPALRTGEAIVAGEAVTLPSRVSLDPPDPWPRASDPDLTSWRAGPKRNELDVAIARWRGLEDAENV